MSIWKRKLRFCQPLDIYTAQHLPLCHRTIEHVIPNSILKKVLSLEDDDDEDDGGYYRYNGGIRYKLYNRNNRYSRKHYPSILSDPLNLFVTSSAMNSFRSNYKYGMVFRSPPVLLPTKQDRSGDFIQRDTAHRTFYPIINQRLLGHTVLNMYRRYPRLEEKHNEIFADERVLDTWLKQPWVERERNMLQWKWLIFGEKSV
uniref:Uncharacterized protein n=1 Tax=viral metagenome TaxID=1070528 RepID=A0A6C0D2Q1_9ZZZZ